MEQKIFADLHNHTTASDGDFTPEQMVEQAHEKAIQVIGITDHDTLSGLWDAIRAGRKFKVDVIPGVEVSIRFKRSCFTGTLHLLCYFSPDKLNDQAFINQFNTILALGRGEKLVRARIDEINKIFGPGNAEALLERQMVYEDISTISCNATRRHFALALEKTFGITDKDTINRIIGNDSPAYLPSGMELSAMAALIRSNTMVTALAHPAAGSFPGPGHYREVLPPVEIVEQILPEFVDIGINALEVHYPGHSKDHQDLMKTWAQQYGLILTGGSDCHDAIDRPFGVQGLSESEFKIFKAALKKE
ncbi:MAG: PHP domain-containing protein [Pseudomonadota bacterium]